MKLLIITQKVDVNDPVLGFFHRWLQEFAKHYERLTVICLQKGEYNLPSNVKVLSLGKEKPQALKKFRYILNFFKHVWRERYNYDTVFVHMNQEYVLLAGWWWRLMGKKVYLWRNHQVGNWLTDLAAFWCHRVFCTSKYSYTAKYKKTEIMPVGIDTDYFKPDPSVRKVPNSILALGRISPIKHLEILVKALFKLQKANIEFTATIVGSPISETDKEYELKLRKLAKELIESGKLIFRPALPNLETPDIYRAHEVYVNLTPSGSFDKAIIEAMACGIPTLISNFSLSEKIDYSLLFVEGDSDDLVSKLEKVLGWGLSKRCQISSELRLWATKNHSLEKLARVLFFKKKRK